jgi:hypothetical protein
LPKAALADRISGHGSKEARLDETTLRSAERMLRMPPKPHQQMKIGKPKAKPKAREEGTPKKKRGVT